MSESEAKPKPRPSLLGAQLHLGPRAGGAKKTVELALGQARRFGHPAYVLSPRPEEIVKEAERQGVLVRPTSQPGVVSIQPLS